jgi:hypothetical protein
MFVHKWRRCLLLQRVVAPGNVHRHYARSQEWQECACVLHEDFCRRPRYARGVQWVDVLHLMTAYALLHRNDRYIQGYLYLALPLMKALPHGLHLGALTEILGALRIYGPSAAGINDFEEHQRAVSKQVAQNAITICLKRCGTQHARAVQAMTQCAAFRHMLSMRWLYILFGQNVTNVDAALAIWDYALHDLVYGEQAHLHALAVHMLVDWVTMRPADDLHDAEDALGRAFSHTWDGLGVARVLRAARATASIDSR